MSDDINQQLEELKREKIFDLKDDEEINHTAVLTLNMISNSRFHYAHAIGILSYLHDERRQDEEMQISFDFIKDRIASILSAQYESIIYINRRNKRYLCKGKPINGLNSEGNLKEIINLHGNVFIEMML